MDNLNYLIEKYKKEMMSVAKQNGFIEQSVAKPGKEEIISEDKRGVKEMNKEPSDEAYGHFGSLKVSVYSGSEAFPIETARVEVFDENGTELYSLLTNSGGIAEGIILAAPPKSRNEEPGGETGFSLYKIRVTHPDYYSDEFDDVQIFEGVESIQQVFLRPLIQINDNGEEYDG